MELLCGLLLGKAEEKDQRPRAEGQGPRTHFHSKIKQNLFNDHDVIDLFPPKTLIATRADEKNLHHG